MSIDQHRQYGAAELLERTLTDTRGMRRFLDRVVIQATANVLRLGYPMAMLLVIDWPLALVALSVLVPQWLFQRYLQQRLHRAADQRRTTQSQLTNVVKETLDGIETIKTLDANTSAVAAIAPCAEKLEQDELYANKFTALLSANVWLLTSVGLALVWGLGAWRVHTQQMTLGELVAFAGFAVFAYQPFRQFSTIVSTYRQGLVSLERIAQLLRVEPAIAERPDAQALQIHSGRIEFRGVDFVAGETQVLSQINLNLPARTLTAVVGKSGAGKSSLLRLIPRLYDPQQGEVLVDGQPLTGATLGSVRSQMALVPQQPIIFSGTILDNIRLGRPDATEDEIERACVSAGALLFISQLEKGFQTRIGVGGDRLSGGQIQRLAIARALLNCPQILLLDEPTSALDNESEMALIRKLCRLRGEMTILVVAHRPLAACHADQIVVMDQGRVADVGEHEDLRARCRVYRELFSPHEFVDAAVA
ncbi:MAG: ATP-binding cassette domain-containing protein [Planctomycetales bacterium]|nr:ATP-binding cassette domain-containing protein [Planctomycetales bacterium]NIO33889.1 ATP-binding cassette domain-containing protein [Planctomycetales bacterium]NIO45697.1 ATP-binding cassette domain-containing protein [Planctomycetales bacterium]NIP84535.1 ATP-binding cassette domain-containing protein [Planctomycetales bacterium]